MLSYHKRRWLKEAERGRQMLEVEKCIAGGKQLDMSANMEKRNEKTETR
jgi:hypothetical protein